MNAEFQWWLLILGIVIGGALVYLVLAEVQGDAESADEPLGPRPDADPDGEPVEPWRDEPEETVPVGAAGPVDAVGPGSAADDEPTGGSVDDQGRS